MPGLIDDAAVLFQGSLKKKTSTYGNGNYYNALMMSRVRHREAEKNQIQVSLIERVNPNILRHCAVEARDHRYDASVNTRSPILRVGPQITLKVNAMTDKTTSGRNASQMPSQQLGESAFWVNSTVSQQEVFAVTEVADGIASLLVFAGRRVKL